MNSGDSDSGLESIVPRINPDQFREDVQACLAKGGWPLHELLGDDWNDRFRSHLRLKYVPNDIPGTAPVRHRVSEYVRAASARFLSFTQAWETLAFGVWQGYVPRMMDFDLAYLEAAAVVHWDASSSLFAERFIGAAAMREDFPDEFDAHYFWPDRC
ncbi:MAG: hypothetical protein HONBIEJF_02634 [Fimbriimonadaceae bacterium]|nr:hypothetical protein [Fimbriimonadaceae bacterium]